MLFTIEKPFLLWDNWLFFWNNQYYLFYLRNREGGPWDSFGLAIGPDGVHFRDLGPILEKNPKATWMGTGHVWKSPNFASDGKFIINYSEWHGSQKEGQQFIFFAESTDLVHWKKLGENNRFGPDPRFYNLNKGDWSRWDTINPHPRAEGGYYGYWTATPLNHPAGTGFGESIDGIHWTALPPPEIDWGTMPIPKSIEIGGVEKLGTTYFMMIGAFPPNPQKIGGMYMLKADNPKGPFKMVEKNSDLLVCPSGWTYYARFFPQPQNLFVNHQSIVNFTPNGNQRIVYVAPIKKAILDNQGMCYLAYWEQNDRLKSKRFDPNFTHHYTLDTFTIVPAKTLFDRLKCYILEWKIPLPTNSTESIGLGFEITIPKINDTLWFTANILQNGRFQVGILDSLDGTFEEINQVVREFPFGKQCLLRILFRDGLFEVYLDEILLQCVTIPYPPTGKIGLFLKAHGEKIQNLPKNFHMWEE